jgi:hypothetical protein
LESTKSEEARSSPTLSSDGNFLSKTDTY